MTLPLNDGLPVAGRELDAWCGQHVLKLNIVHHNWPCGYVPDGCSLEAAVFVTAEHKPVYDWFDQPGPVYLPEHGTWPPERYTGYADAKEFYCCVEPVPFVSTTHAYYQVMETAGYKFGRIEDDDVIYYLMYDTLLDHMNESYLANIVLEKNKYNGSMEMDAHAVCACVWKAKGGDL